MANQNNQENTNFNDQADGKFDNVVNNKLMAKGVTSDDDESAGEVNLRGTDASSQVRATEDASLQDDTYAFDESNTDNEDFHDLDDDDGAELDFE